MDQSDIFEYFVDAVSDLDLSDLAKLADYSLNKDWFVSGPSQDDVIEQVSIKIYSKYFDSCAADHWGANTYAQWYIQGALDVATDRQLGASPEIAINC